MPELLLELFSEEIPARFQRRAAEELKKAVTDAMVENGLLYESAGAFVTPRRLALTVTGIPPASPDTREERKGPRVGAPEKAVEGFLRGAGLSSIDEAKIDSDPKKGDFYVAVIEKKGAPATEILAEQLPKIINGFSWAKSMRWGAGRLNWVRPLRAITATFGTENDEPEIIDFAADGIASGQTTFGHRFLAPDAIRVKRFDDYVQKLEKAKVVLDLDRRKDIIRADADQLAFAQNLELIDDAALLEEVAGLVEWPVVMMGSFERKLPRTARGSHHRHHPRQPEMLLSAGRKNPESWRPNSSLRPTMRPKTAVRPSSPAMSGSFARGSATPCSFTATICPIRSESRLPKLTEIIFHAKLGTQAERVERLEALAAEIAPLVGADVEMARRAAKLAKADLVTGMVGEFPELQGLMGRYYAEAQGEPGPVSNAIEMHYKPLGPSDEVPTDPVAIAVALADKLDTLTGFWAIDEKPTGSRDPYALRRAALGVIRIVVENEA